MIVVPYPHLIPYVFVPFYGLGQWGTQICVPYESLRAHRGRDAPLTCSCSCPIHRAYWGRSRFIGILASREMPLPRAVAVSSFNCVSSIGIRWGLEGKDRSVPAIEE